MYIHSMFSSRKGLRQDLSVYMVNMVIVGLEITSFLSIQSIFNQSMDWLIKKKKKNVSGIQRKKGRNQWLIVEYVEHLR